MSSKMHIGARIEPELHEAITASAQEKGTSISEEVNTLLSRGLNLVDDENEDRGQSPLYAYFPKAWVQELFYLIQSEYEAWEDEPEVEEYLEGLAELSLKHAAKTANPNQRLMAIPDLPVALRTAVDEKLNELLDLAEELVEREIFLQQWAHSLEGKYADPVDDDYELRLYFDEETMVQIRELLVRRNREPGEQDVHKALSRLVYQLLGEALLEEAEPLFFGGYEREEMAKVGEALKEYA